ncbi:LpxI family protein [Novipirellula artificiosorum]|uniref:DUF1009 domain-containing protein n=1 Tax=Novipirellula artificiosorum TaxID=2528016 RepID=A0A5C6DCJ0_9BACT|nr:UDP-2,3-diacylglucosamine diphosphatase LpxI [Novipirellula artificiosorum]TWU34472.1 hypothetical protein Poly41_46200 [Novipirellula artificiosorum]
MPRPETKRITPPPIGLIAGWGRFPIEVARAIVAGGGNVCCIAIRGHASDELEAICESVKWSGVGRVGGHIRHFRRSGVEQVAMAGKLFKSDLLFSGSLWLRHLPDLQCLRTFGPLLFGRKRDARDDRLLLAVTNTYNRSGLQVCAPTDFAPELLVNHGMLTGQRPNAGRSRDIEVGWRVARQMGGMDIGQSITIKDGAVIAVEAIEGTDACIDRTGELCRRGGWTLVKVSKPNQDMRFDVPTIGPQTVDRVHKAGGTTIVIEADKTILVDRDETLAKARQAGIAIVAMKESDFQCNRVEAA